MARLSSGKRLDGGPGQRPPERLHDLSPEGVLDGIGAPSAVLAADGRIVAVNAAWVDATLEGGGSLIATGVGADYLAVCDAAAAEADATSDDAPAGGATPTAGAVASALRSVLEGRTETFMADYPCLLPDGEVRWWSLRAAHLPGGGAVVTHLDVTSIKQAEEFLGQAPGGVLAARPAAVAGIYDVDGRLLEVSAGAISELALPEHRRAGSTLADHLTGDDLARAHAALRRLADVPGGREHLRLRVRDGDGRVRVLDYVAERLDQPGPPRVAVLGVEVTESERRVLRRHLHERLVDQFPTAVLATDHQGTVVLWNERVAELTGLQPVDVLGRPIGELGVLPGPEVAAIAEHALRHGAWEGDIDSARPDGAPVSLHVVARRVDDDRLGFRGYAVTAIDISERRALERRLAFQATHDEMTGLPNRRQLVDRLQRAVAAARSGDHEVAVIELDIDDFGSVNEALGHDGGDRVLRAVAERAARALRPCDLISRYGGDELVVVAPVTGGLPEALDLVSALQGALREPVTTGRGRLALSAAFGVAVGVDLGEALLRAADVAMYEAKEAGRGQVGVFDAGLRAQRQRTREVVAALGEALDAGQLTAHFQPVVDVATGRLAGFEALARIEHPARGLIGPAEFVPAAEDSGLIDRLGLAVLDQACAALATWSAEPGPPLTLAVNVSARQLEGAGFVDAVAAAVSRHGVATDQVCLEVTESTMTEQATALRALRDLRDLGVRVALDDFGTGYSSLDRLRRLPIDRLKVDRTFIQHLPSDRASQVIVGAVVALARALGLDVVAEGVELHAQLDALRELACPAAQGFLWSPAVPAPAALAMVRAGEGWAAPGLVAG